MDRRDFLKKCGAVAAAGFVFSNCNIDIYQGTKKPNIVFIMTDQHNAHALGCYGNTEVSTPNMDRIAAGGVLFDRAYCQTGQCVPSRYSIFTGRYARSHGTYSNGQIQNPQERTVAELFAEAGYVSATIGKHHMVMDETTGNHGFDLVAVPSADLTGKGNFLPYDEVHPGRSEVGETSLTNDEHRAGQTAAQTTQFIRDNKDKPFVVWCSFYGPHTPITPSAPWSTQYDQNDVTLPPNLHVIDEQMPGYESLLSKSGTYSQDYYHSATLAYYYGLVSQIDYNIGRVLDELDELGLTGKTVVVYTADHGEMMSEHGAWTKGRTGYEAQIRIPLILRFPGAFTRGKRSSELVGSIDLLPTLLDAANLPKPANLDGSSLMPLIRGKVKKWRQYIFSEIGSSSDNTCIMTRSKTHKYVLFRTAGQTEHEQLFDMVTDPWEMNNLIAHAGYADVLTELKNALAKWEADTPPASPMAKK